MTRDLTESLHQYVSASGAGAFILDGARARRVRSSVARRRLVRSAAVTTGTLAVVGGVVAGAAYASHHGFFGIGDGTDPSPSPSGSVRPSPTAEPSPSPTAEPSPTDTLAPNTWPDQEPSWVVETVGSQVEPIECGVRLSDLPTGVVTIDEARRATRDEVAAMVAEILAGGATETTVEVLDSLVLSDQMYLAAWNVDDAALTNYPSTGAFVIHTGLEVGFGPWEGKMLEWFGRQLWGGYAVVEDGSVVARGHQADASVGAGVINTPNIFASDEWLGGIGPQLTLVTRPWQGVEWCPGVTPGQEGRDLVVVAAASAPDGAPTYAWAVLPSD